MVCFVRSATPVIGRILLIPPLSTIYCCQDRLMTGHDQFQWQVLDHALSRARAQRKHVILRVYLHYPGQPLRVPQFLLDHPIPLVTLVHGETSPQYDDPILLRHYVSLLWRWAATMTDTRLWRSSSWDYWENGANFIRIRTLDFSPTPPRAR